eukprot:TRINITY_DN29730_c0_g1_i1.p1 TRINITY_DN29730_c0_g1~~TRINITY_DN29730_c0_g1_i1.p1  ORF type:complete len:1074 (+),score=175.39 TRINITY_DN29730_c0_g1_i1:111-3224(+)
MLQVIAFACLAAGAAGQDQSTAACNATSCTTGSMFLQAHQERVKPAIATLRTGFMSMWSGTVVGGSCEYANDKSGALNSPAATSPYISGKVYCAADSALYAAGASCGSCWRVSYDGSPATESGQPGSMVIQIVGSGSPNTFECHLTAFQQITRATSGVFPVTYESVGCETGSQGGVATVLDGNNAWYTKVIFSNLPDAVVGASMMVKDRVYTMSRVSGATWQANTGGQSGSVSFSVSLGDGSTVQFDSCFSSWPVATGEYCSTDAEFPMPSPAPVPMPVPMPMPLPTPVPAPMPVPPALPVQCSAAGEDCRNTKCCTAAGYDCYEKDQYWASCRQSCIPGINPLDPPEYQTPWTCARLDGSLPAPTPTLSPSPVPSPAPSSMPSPVPSPGTSPMLNPNPILSADAFTTDTIGSSLNRLSEFVVQLTDQPVQGSAARAVHSSGGAAGGVVSEGQGYGLLLAGVAFASLDSSNSKWEQTGDLAYEMFLGWRRMCELSASSGSCQDDEGFKCGGGNYPCLPHWKFGDDLTSVIGKGAAPDGDADALAGMLLAVMAARRTSSQPTWLDEMGRWTYETCVQFYESSTISSPTGSHRIVKLGSCWGGWGNDGQNPSYHAPGVYRMCKHYMEAFDNEFGASNSEGDDYKSKWETLIDTSYKMFHAVQCPSTGLITNWAKISEAGEQLTASTGFSGSGTPGAEYGAEASRAVWRVALDYLLFPAEAGSDAAAFLRPVTAQLETKESSGTWSDNLDIDGYCLVESIHDSWSWNMFMAGPTFSALVSPAGLTEGRQQQLADSAGARVASSSIRDYYSGSWIAISTMTLNGDLSKAALNAGLMTSQGSSSLSTSPAPPARATTRTTTTSTIRKDFSAVNGGSHRVCRGSTHNDNSNSFYSVVKATSLDACKEACEATSACVGIEFKSPRCEVWTRTEGIQATRSLAGYTCLRYGEAVVERQGSFAPVDGGSGRACRGASSTDNLGSYYQLLRLSSEEACQSSCRQLENCKGIEWSYGRCEMWTRTGGIEATRPVPGFKCLRFVEVVED